MGHFVPCTVHFVPCTVHFVPCTVHFVPCTVHFVPCTVHFVPCTVHFVPCTVHFVPCTVHFVPCTVHFVPCTVHFVPCTVRRHRPESQHSPTHAEAKVARTIDQQIAEAQAKLSRLKSRQKASDTRRKIIVGSVVISNALREPDKARALAALLGLVVICLSKVPI